jgi:hypothetical protein
LAIGAQGSEAISELAMHNGVAHFGHQCLVIVQVVDGIQDAGENFASPEQVV